MSISRRSSRGAALSCGYQATGIFQVFVLDGVDGPVRESPQRVGWIPRCVLRVHRGADDEYIGNVPRLQVAIDHAGTRIAAHHRTARVVSCLILRGRIGGFTRAPRDLL